MSFSFAVRAKTGAAAVALVKEKLDEVAVQQPVHKLDLPLIGNVVDSYVELAGEPPAGNVLVVNVNGSIWLRTDGTVGGVSCGVNVAFALVSN